MPDDQKLLSSSFRHLRFSLALPLYSLIIAVLCLASVVPGMLQVGRAAAHPGIMLDGKVLAVDPSIAVKYYSQSWNRSPWALPDPLHAVALLNTPSMLGEIAVSLPTTWPDSWHPSLAFPFNDLWFWRAVTWPIYALPFWWLGGRAIDALRALRRGRIYPIIRLPEVFIMAVAGAFSCMMAIVLILNPGIDNSADGSRWGVIPAFFWLALTALPYIAWRRQRRFKILAAPIV